MGYLVSWLWFSNAVSQTNPFLPSTDSLNGSPEARSGPATSPMFGEDVWFLGALGFGILLAGLIAWRFRHALSGSSRRPARQSLSAGSSATVSQTSYFDQGAEPGPDAEPISTPPTETTSSDVAVWQQRALSAESRAERATAVVRAGLTPHLARMMKDQLVWTLMAQRTHMVSTQDVSAEMVSELEQRLELIQSEFESRVETYEKRIAELERELETKSQVNRELLGATIDMAKKAMQDVAIRRPNSPFAAKYLTQKPEDEGARPGSNGKLSFGDIMARRVSRESR
jgi:hypothetical protein